MRRFVKEVGLYLFTLGSLYVAVLVLLALSTLWTSRIENALGLSRYHRGGQHQRSIQLEEWTSDEDEGERWLFVGASPSFRNINVVLLDSLLGINSFNAASSGMPAGIARFIVEGIHGARNVDHVVLELTPLVWSQYRSRTLDDWILNADDPFKSYLFELVRERGFFREYVYLSYVSIKRILFLTNGEYRDDPEEDVKEYVKGFGCFESEGFELRYQDREFFWSDDNLAAVSEIVAFCEDNGIGLTLLISPTHGLDYELDELSSYRSVLLDMSQSIEEIYFIDEVHLNCDGAQHYTVKLASQLRRSI